jgi:hypothetical protein
MALETAAELDNALIPYTTTPEVQKVIDVMGRTEDMQFSPDRKWLAVAGFRNSKLYLYATNILTENNSKVIHLDNSMVLDSSSIREPHGLHYMDDRHLLIANRAGAIVILRIPDLTEDNAEYKIKPVATIRTSLKCRVKSPGSICSYRMEDGRYRVLACNNYIDTVTSHIVTLGEKVTVENEGVLIRKNLAIPDGICLSPDNQWLAVSNHSHGTVLMYRFDENLHKNSDPDGVLEGIVCPHAIRFSQDGKMVLVADSASAYMHLYHRRGDGWTETQKPEKTIRILEDDVFKAGRANAQEGGLKGTDIVHDENLLVVCCEHLGMAFFHLDEVLDMAHVEVDEEIRVKSLERDIEIMAS